MKKEMRTKVVARITEYTQIPPQLLLNTDFDRILLYERFAELNGEESQIFTWKTRFRNDVRQIEAIIHNYLRNKKIDLQHIVFAERIDNVKNMIQVYAKVTSGQYKGHLVCFYANIAEETISIYTVGEEIKLEQSGHTPEVSYYVSKKHTH